MQMNSGRKPVERRKHPGRLAVSPRRYKLYPLFHLMDVAPEPAEIVQSLWRGELQNVTSADVIFMVNSSFYQLYYNWLTAENDKQTYLNNEGFF